MTLHFSAQTYSGSIEASPLQAFHFPGGEAHIKGADDPRKFKTQIADMRGANADDLMMLAMWVNSCHARKELTVLLLPYLPGARADRGVPFGANVYAKFLNSLGISRILAVDAHSKVMPALLNRLTVFPFERILRGELGSKGDIFDHPYVGVIAPDKGAVDRATRAAEVLHVPVFLAEKHRDFQTGKLSGFSCETLPREGRLLLVDDICDGGGTFNGLADEISIGRDRLDLWVTHGIFSHGIAELEKRFGHIYTTDSHPGQEPFAALGGVLTVFRVYPYLIGEITNG